MKTLEDIAWEILNSHPEFLEMPTSLSGKYHRGETHREHAIQTANVMKHLCREFNISDMVVSDGYATYNVLSDEKNRKMRGDYYALVAAALLHDLGLSAITVKWSGPDNLPEGWKYYEATGYARYQDAYDFHGLLSASFLPIDMPRRKSVERMCACHMEHWCPKALQPTCFHDKLMCIADYVSAKHHVILTKPED